MKKSILILVSSILFLQINLYSNGVSQQTAQTVAVNFFKVTANISSTPVATLSYTQTESNGSVDFYVFNIQPTGFVIVSADDAMNPVIGYSTDENFDVTASGIKNWINNTAEKIHNGVAQQVQADTRISGLWNSYLIGQAPLSGRSTAVPPLLQTRWNQEPYYNTLCPYNSTDQQRAVTGCVATTMAQIMKYWAYPTRGTGSYSYTDAPPNYSNNYGTQSANFGNMVYKWSNMPNSITNNSNSVDTLMYHCGVSVAMDYGDANQGGSGAAVLQSEAGGGNNPCAEYAYVNYFSYNPNTIQGVHFSDYSTANWIALMESELNAGRVIQYEGYDPSAGGHTWVCDGYDANNLLHMNWGWGGASNGYFDVSNLNPSGYTFSQGDAALIGIEPLSPININAYATNAAICAGSSTTLVAQGPASATYSWTPTTGLSCATCATTSVSPSSTTVYTVAVDSAGVVGHAVATVGITTAAVANFSVNVTAACSVPQNAAFTNTSLSGSTYSWDFGDGTTNTQNNPIHAYTDFGDYTVQLTATNACGSNTVTKNQVVHIFDPSPVAANVLICKGTSAVLNATAAGTVSWYSSPAGGSAVGTGSTFTSPPLSSTTIYYAENVSGGAVPVAGPANHSFGAGGYNSYAHYLVFNNTKAQQLVSVMVDAQTAGSRTIELHDASDNVLATATVNLTTGIQTVNLNFALPVQNNLRLGIWTGTIALYRNSSGATYPYTSTDNSVVITTNDVPDLARYYFLYDWKLQQASCISNRTPVTANVFASTNFVAGVNGTTVSFAPTNPYATSLSWNFGDGATSTDGDPTHTYSSFGTYTVQLIESNGTCTDTVTKSVSVIASGIDELNGVGNISLLPNPTSGLLNLQLNTNLADTNLKLSIHNILGETLITQDIHLTAGVNNRSFDVSSFAPGVYFFSLQNGKTAVTKRFIKE